MRVAALVPDLLFGSKVKATLEQAGHEVALVGPAPVGYTPEVGSVDVLVVDLTVAGVDVEAIGRSGVPTLGFFAHVEPEVRAAALAAGFDVVVPRSRFAREGAELVERLVASGSS